jgi:sigma-B regulation protein RsbU (phosphoserine phosphatase)
MESELQIARDIQMTMLPKTFPPFPDRSDIDVYAQLKPAKEVGGDLYDFFVRDEKLFFCIGDVSGKGVPASLVMAVTMALFRTLSSHEANPERIISRLNNTISEGNDSEMFVTLFLGVLDLPTGRLRYANAGHNAPLLIESEGKKVTMLDVNPNLPVGIMHDWKYIAQEKLIEPNSAIFLYTDGLTEAENINQQLFGEKRLINAIQQVESTLQPHTFIEHIFENVKQFVGEADQSDDLTMMAVRYSKEQQAFSLERSIELTNDIKQVSQLTAFVDEVCEIVGVDMSTTMSLNLALEEAVVNVMDYGYPAGQVGHIEVKALANEMTLTFVISDDGIPFDPTAKSEVDTTLSVE